MPFSMWGQNPTFGTPAGGNPKGAGPAAPSQNMNKLQRMKSPKAQKQPNYSNMSKPKEFSGRIKIREEDNEKD